MIRDDPSERLEYIKSTTLPGVEMLFAYESSQPWHVFHERYAFCACRIAHASWRYRGHEHLSTNRSSMLLEPGETHCNTAIQGRSEFKVVFIPESVLGIASQELGLGSAPHFRSANTNDPMLFNAIYDFCSKSLSSESELEKQTLFTQMLSAILRYEESPPAETSIRGCRAAIGRARRYIAERYDQPISLDELAQIAGLSRFHLIRVFNRYAGLPPHAYQIHVRVANALRLLRQGSTVARAALLTGFADQSHFTRCFRKVMKVTPSQYAREHRRGTII